MVPLHRVQVIKQCNNHFKPNGPRELQIDHIILVQRSGCLLMRFFLADAFSPDQSFSPINSTLKSMEIFAKSFRVSRVVHHNEIA